MLSQKNSIHRHFKLYKPYGYISQFVINGRQKRQKKLLGELYDFPEGTMAIGRLDEKSEGLLLLTTDGKTSTLITSGGIEKEYYVQVDGSLSSDSMETMRQGVTIGFDGKKYQTQPCIVELLPEIPDLPERSKKIRDSRHGPTTWIKIVITEGKFRQVRKMTSAVGHPTLRLVRVRIGNIHLGDLAVGMVEELVSIP
ncbi:ribulose phosphate epimerase [Hanstruepera neustonica]|uniref:Pseudouridine synthase n=1 Tax=Hanstruepera neustonica TaxID=1445657 RepID=A0A2K1DYJ0_9FLAO|nr:pseudouridine synthase [Hanstruepera neustonica]PNQ73099.1 ribulose phosphate epimerase [Hanstruepera neustonica]